MFKTLLLFWLIALQALGASAGAPITVAGQVSRVTDGDSLWLTLASSGEPLQIRLLNIDAPEICQAWGEQAKQALADLVLGKTVTARTEGQDSYGRTLATLFVDNLNINKTLVQEGHAWSSRYKYDRGPFVADERMAKALSRGLNRKGGAVMPKDFRRSHGPCVAGEAAVPPAAATTPNAAPLAALSGAPGYRCDGRTHCSQMRSCAEASYFLKTCPGVKMDGNHDGVPCEQQWCRPGR